MKKIIYFLITIPILLISCKPELSGESNKQPLIGKITEFHIKNRNEQQVVTINSGIGAVINASKGAKIHLPANGFITEDGQSVTGNVNVLVKEIFTPMEMILNDMPTTSGGQLLESGGEFLIKVSQNNDPLKLAPGNFIRIVIPDIKINMQGMQVFNGVADASGKVDWVLNNNPGNFVVRDSTLFSNTNLFSDKVNWINCDKFINDPTVEFSVYPGNAPYGDSTNVFVHLTGRNTVVKMNWTQGLNYFKSNMLLAVPSTIVGISAKKGGLYASILTVTVQNGKSTTMNFLPFSEKQLKDRLSKLK